MLVLRSNFSALTSEERTNLEESIKQARLKGVTEKDITRMKKYHKAYLYLIQ